MRKLLCVLAVMGMASFGYAEEVKLKIKGMVCEFGCVTKVNKALTKVKGVKSKKVEVGKATVKFDEKSTTRAEIVKAIEAAGFKVAKK